jgi:hypothetical protein
MRDSLPDDSLKVSDQEARRLLARAAELEGAVDSLSIAQLRHIASEASISARSFDAALEEFGDALSRVRDEGRGSVARPPAWVRLCMFAVPDRRAAAAYYWLFVAGLVAFPVNAVLSDGFSASSIAGMAFCTFALWSTSRAIQWLDVHGWDLLSADPHSVKSSASRANEEL